MTREIKFRAWDKKNNSWYENCNNGLMIDGETGEVLRNEVCAEENEVILMQFTGLKDSKGVEIWEGDIVNYYGRSDLIVEFYNAHFIICYPRRTNHEDLWKALKIMPVEVIGNIYENPELLT